jgi:hypothetical protein
LEKHAVSIFKAEDEASTIPTYNANLPFLWNIQYLRRASSQLKLPSTFSFADIDEYHCSLMLLFK